MNQKSFVNIILVVIIVILVGAVGYFALHKPKPAPINQVTTPNDNQVTQNQPPTTNNNITPKTPPSNDATANWKTYKNDTYGFELKYPSAWILRDGSKDYKPQGLNNFYQFCGEVITKSDESLGPNDNFVGICKNEYFRVNIWKPTVEIKFIASDFATLKLDRENKITIGGKPASEFIYSGHSQIWGGAHTWHLFIVRTNDFVYSMVGDSCTDNKIECNQILSTFKFTQ